MAVVGSSGWTPAGFEPYYLEQTVMESQKLSFTLERETKNTIRYAEDASGKPPAIGTLYVQKWMLGQDPPKNLIVTISGSDISGSDIAGSDSEEQS
jgi:hypothetical protein